MGYHGEPVLDGDLVRIKGTGDVWEGCWGIVDTELSVDVTDYPKMVALRPLRRDAVAPFHAVNVERPTGKPWPDGSNRKAIKVVFLRLVERRASRESMGGVE